MGAASITPHRSTLARSAARGLRSQSSIEAHGDPGQISVYPKKLNLRAPPNTLVTQHFQLTNGAAYVSGSDPDHCTTPLTEFGGGLQVAVTVKVNGTRYGSNSTCIGVAGAFVFARKKSFSITHYTPDQPGEYKVDYDFYLAGSGKHIKTIRKTLEVTGSAPKPPAQQPQQNGGSGLFNGPILPCFLDPNRACTTGSTIGYSAFGILALLFVLRFVLL